MRASRPSSAQTAREVLKIAAEEERHRRDIMPEPAARVLQDEIEAQTNSTLNTVHDMLDKVVGRLSLMEHEIADVRQRPAVSEAGREAPAPVTRAKAPIARPVIGEPSREIRLGGMEPRMGSAPAKPQRKAEPAPVELDAGRRADFIAAARRAAATAQAEAAAAQRQMPTDKVARAGLLARSRDYVATHKRPMLMSIAALMLALGVVALMDRTGGFGGGVELASAPARSAPIAVADKAAPTRIADAGLDALSPSALPKTTAPLANPIPGSDPIQTGSIPSLPSFAAGAAPAAAAASHAPAGPLRGRRGRRRRGAVRPRQPLRRGAPCSSRHEARGELVREGGQCRLGAGAVPASPRSTRKGSA